MCDSFSLFCSCPITLPPLPAGYADPPAGTGSEVCYQRTRADGGVCRCQKPPSPSPAPRSGSTQNPWRKNTRMFKFLQPCPGSLRFFSNNSSQPQCWTLTELTFQSAIFVVKGFKRKKPRGFQAMKKQGGTVSHSCTNYLMNDIISKQTLTNSAINKMSHNWSVVYLSQQRINQLTTH